MRDVEDPRRACAARSAGAWATAQSVSLLAVVLPAGDRRVGLDGRLVGAVADEALLRDEVGLGEALLDVAEVPVHLGVDVVRVARVLRVDQRGAGGDRRLGVEDGGQLLVLDLDQAQRPLGRLLVDRGHGGHLVADVAHPLLGQDVLVVAGRAHAVARCRARPGPVITASTPGSAARPAGVDALDQPVGDGAAEDLAVDHARQAEVGGVLAAAGDLVRRVVAGHAVPDDGVVAVLLACSPGRGAVSSGWPANSRQPWTALTMRG